MSLPMIFVGVICVALSFFAHVRLPFQRGPWVIALVEIPGWVGFALVAGGLLGVVW